MKKLLWTMTVLSSLNSLNADPQLATIESSRASIRTLVEALPQIYQPIYKHPELTDGKSIQRICTDRKTTILQLIDLYLASAKKDQISVLDIGCSQGYFCFEIKEAFGDKVSITGVDLEQKNIDLCRTLNVENIFDIEFKVDRLSREFVEQIADGQYDIILVLSVIHHETRSNGSIYSEETSGCFQSARELLSSIIRKSGIIIVELALRNEFRANFGDLPENCLDWFSGIAFRRLVGHFHRSAVSAEDKGAVDQKIMRPMFIATDKYRDAENPFTE
jgi:O-antigen chain-terminating methyltransferase